MPLAAVAGSVIGGLISSHGASKAASTQADAAAQAAVLAKQNADKAIGVQNSTTQQNQANQDPFLKTGQTAQQDLAAGTRPGGELVAGYGQSFQAPTGVTEQNDPGYQFRLAQGQKALEGSAAARGGLLSGGTAKGLEDYAQGTASNEYGNVYNRALQTFNTGFNQFQTEQANKFNRTATVAGTGQQAANELGQAGQAGASNVGNILTGSTNQVNQQTNNAAAARASGYASNANIWGNVVPGAITGISGMIPGRRPKPTVNNPTAENVGAF